MVKCPYCKNKIDESDIKIVHLRTDHATDIDKTEEPFAPLSGRVRVDINIVSCPKCDMFLGLTTETKKWI